MPSSRTQYVRHGRSEFSGVSGEHTGYTPGYLLSKQQLLVNLFLCGLYSGASNTPEHTVHACLNNYFHEKKDILVFETLK